MGIRLCMAQERRHCVVFLAACLCQRIQLGLRDVHSSLFPRSRRREEESCRDGRGHVSSEAHRNRSLYSRGRCGGCEDSPFALKKAGDLPEVEGRNSRREVGDCGGGCDGRGRGRDREDVEWKVGGRTLYRESALQRS